MLHMTKRELKRQLKAAFFVNDDYIGSIQIEPTCKKVWDEHELWHVESDGNRFEVLTKKFDDGSSVVYYTTEGCRPWLCLWGKAVAFWVPNNIE